MYSRLYGATKPAKCEDFKLRTLHRGRHWRVKTRSLLTVQML